MSSIQCRNDDSSIIVFQAGFKSIFITIPFAATGKTIDVAGREQMTFELTEEQAKFVLSSLGKIYYSESLNRVINEIST